MIPARVLTGYNVREGSAMLAQRREAARRQRVADLARLALLLLDNQPVIVRFPHPESKRA